MMIRKFFRNLFNKEAGQMKQKLSLGKKIAIFGGILGSIVVGAFAYSKHNSGSEGDTYFEPEDEFEDDLDEESEEDETTEFEEVVEVQE